MRHVLLIGACGVVRELIVEALKPDEARNLIALPLIVGRVCFQIAESLTNTCHHQSVIVPKPLHIFLFRKGLLFLFCLIFQRLNEGLVRLPATGRQKIPKE